MSHKVLVYWELDQTLTEGKWAGDRMLIHKEYTMSLSEKSNLRADLESKRGRQYTAEDLQKFKDNGMHLEKLRGIPCQLNVKIKTSRAGKEYPVVDIVLPPTEEGKDMLPNLAEDWEPPKWVKEKIEKGFGATGSANKPEIFDDDVPF